MSKWLLVTTETPPSQSSRPGSRANLSAISVEVSAFRCAGVRLPGQWLTLSPPSTTPSTQMNGTAFRRSS